MKQDTLGRNSYFPVNTHAWSASIYGSGQLTSEVAIRPLVSCGLPDRVRLSVAGYQIENNYPVLYDPSYAVKQCFSNCGLFISGLPNLHKMVSTQSTKVTKMAKDCNCISN